MGYKEIEAIVSHITSASGPFATTEISTPHGTQKVLEGIPESLGAYYALAATHGNKDFLISGTQRLTFQELMTRVETLKGALQGRYQIQKGDHVAIAMRNCPEWCIAFMAITAIGAVAVPLNSWWEHDELIYGLEDSASRLVILDGTRYERIADWLATRQIEVIAVKTGGTPLSPLLDRMNNLLLNDEQGVPRQTSVEGNDPAMILYTSGSAGKPKGVLSTHRNVLSAIGTWIVVGTAAGMAQGPATPKQSNQPAILLSIPLFHVTGLHSLFLLSLAIGRKVVMMHKWDINEALRLIQEERITNFNGVPTMSLELMNHSNLSDYNLSSLLEISSGGAARPPNHVAQLKERFPSAMLSNGYGLTETNALGCIIGYEDYMARPKSVGRPTVPLVDLSIQAEDGTQVGHGEIGEICIRSAAVAVGYWNQPAATATAFRDGWFHTGDAAYQDAEGFVYIVDRIKDIIIRGGENISCVEVEDALYAHADVAEAAVFALPDDRLGEVVGAAVKVRAGASVSAEQIQAFVGGRLAAYKVPFTIWCRDVPLPRTASGKILKRQIRGEILSSLQKS